MKIILGKKIIQEKKKLMILMVKMMMSLLDHKGCNVLHIKYNNCLLIIVGLLVETA